jgi:hypothetical protein
VSVRFGGKPDVIVHLNVKGGFQRVREGTVGVIEVSKVGGVDGSARKKSRGKGRKVFSMVTLKRGVRVTMALKHVSSVAGGFGDDVRTAEAVGKFGDSAGRCVTGDLNSGHNKVTNTVRNSMTGVINTGTMGSASVFSEEAENLRGKSGGRRGETKKGMCILCLGRGRGGSGAKTEVVREAKGATDGRDAADNVSPVDGTAVPCIGSSMGGFDKNGVSTAVVRCNRDSFVKEAMEFFDTNCFVIALGGNVERDTKERTNGFKGAFESTAIVDDDEAAKANFEEDFLHEQPSKIRGGDIGGSGNKNKTSKVAHNVEEVCVATVIGDVAGCPEVNV